jgi:universal stress protein E
LLKPYESSIEPDHQVLLDGEPEKALRQFTQDERIDLLVMGTLVRTGIAGLLIGNTAERVLRNAECSVLAIKPEGFVSPI